MQSCRKSQQLDPLERAQSYILTLTKQNAKPHSINKVAECVY